MDRHDPIGERNERGAWRAKITARRAGPRAPWRNRVDREQRQRGAPRRSLVDAIENRHVRDAEREIERRLPRGRDRNAQTCARDHERFVANTRERIVG
jgi:hypothetical protein